MVGKVLEGAEAFLALEEAIAGGTTAFRTTDVAIDRLRRALDDLAATPADLAVLVRQVLRAETARRGRSLRPRLPIPAALARDAAFLVRFGLHIDSRAARIEADPWDAELVRRYGSFARRRLARGRRGVGRASPVRAGRCWPAGGPFPHAPRSQRLSQHRPARGHPERAADPARRKPLRSTCRPARARA